MAIPSKEEKILKLILETSPLKQWHFDEITKKAGVSRTVANKWLKKYLSKGLITYVKADGKFPYYSVGEKNNAYYAQKKFYALEKIHESGLLAELLSLNAKLVIIFGSMIKGDWYKDSDIDIFIWGNIQNFNKNLYETKLQRRIEFHIFKKKAEIKMVQTGLIENVANGYVVKGDISDLVKK